MCNNCINEQLQAERDELRLQVSALTQALETQKRENQPYIKELEARIGQANMLLLRSNFLLWRNHKRLSGDIKKHLQRGSLGVSAEWIPVTERLPERMQYCLFVVDCKFGHDNGRILGGWFTGEDFVTPGVTWKASRWCPIPDSLLNFKP